MQLESIEFSFLSIFTLITFFIFLIISKYSYRIKGGALLDKDFLKPQAFHHHAISRRAYFNFNIIQETNKKHQVTCKNIFI